MKETYSPCIAYSTVVELVNKEHGGVSSLSDVLLKICKLSEHFLTIGVVMEIGQLYAVEFDPDWDLTVPVGSVHTGQHLEKSLKVEN